MKLCSLWLTSVPHLDIMYTASQMNDMKGDLMSNTRNILITGGLGFIGSNLVNRLYELGHSIVNIDCQTYASSTRNLTIPDDAIAHSPVHNSDHTMHSQYFHPRYRYYHHNIVTMPADEWVRMQREDGISPDIIIHTAAESHVDRSIIKPGNFINTNVIGTYNVLEAARKLDVEKVIVLGTDEEYGDACDQASIDVFGSRSIFDEYSYADEFHEEDPLRPSSPYSVSKAASSLLALSYHRTYDLPTIVIRPCNNYGPRQYPEKLVPVIINKLANGERVPVYGDGAQVREWIYVQDCVEGIITVMERGTPGEVYNLGSGYRCTNLELISDIHFEMFEESYGKSFGSFEDIVEFVRDRPGHDRKYAINSDKIRALGWEPKVEDLTGLEDTIKWYMGGVL